MRLIDSHCHLDSIKDYKISDKVLPVTAGYSHSSNVKTLEIAKKFQIPFVLGISPQAAQKEGIKKLGEWTEWIKGAMPNAIGEIGLDNHWAKTEEDRANQNITFAKMLDLAENMGLPIVIHAREAISDILKILEERKFSNGFMMHFFSGTDKEARKVVDLGGFISITPLHSKSRVKVINAIELEYILAETDAPAIVRLPEDVEKSISYIKEIKKLDFASVAEQTAKNARKFFKI